MEMAILVTNFFEVFFVVLDDVWALPLANHALFWTMDFQDTKKSIVYQASKQSTMFTYQPVELIEVHFRLVNVFDLTW